MTKNLYKLCIISCTHVHVAALPWHQTIHWDFVACMNAWLSGGQGTERAVERSGRHLQGFRSLQAVNHNLMNAPWDVGSHFPSCLAVIHISGQLITEWSREWRCRCLFLSLPKFYFNKRCQCAHFERQRAPHCTI